MRGAYSRIEWNRGMSLLEVLVSLSVLLILISILPVFLSSITIEKVEKIDHEEIVIFFSQLQLDFRQNDIYWTNTNQTLLFIQRTGDHATIQYELYEDKIRRRVNLLGHEVFLQNVKRLDVKTTSYGAVFYITGVDGSAYSKSFTHPISRWGDKGEE